MEGPLRSALGALGGLLSGLPDLRLPIKDVSPSSWLLNTYLGAWAVEGAGNGSGALLGMNRLPCHRGFKLRAVQLKMQCGGSAVFWPRIMQPLTTCCMPHPILDVCADDSLRITRGDGGSVFVLVKDSYADTG